MLPQVSVPRFAGLVLAASALLLCSPAVHAQGQWYPAWTPCKADGSYQNFYPDEQGMIGLGGLLTGSASGSQSAPYSALRRWLYSPEPGTWMSGGSTLYDPRNEDGPDAGILADAGNILYYPNGYDDDPVSATSSVSGSVGVDLVAYYKWSPYYDDGTDDPTPTTPAPPPPASTNFLLQTSLVAYYSNAYQATSAAASGMSSSSSASDQYGEQVQVVAPGGPYPYRYGSYWVNDTKTAGGRHLVSVPVSLVGGQGVYAVHLSGTTQAQALDTQDANRYQGNAGAGATVNGRVKHDDRAVAISSPIEKSFYKGTDSDSGYPIVLAHTRQPINNVVDSVVFPINDPQTGQHFIAGTTYYSNASSFTFPKFVWSIAGDGTPDGMTTANLNRSPEHPNGLADLPATLDFGNTWDLTKTKTSQIRVNVTDSDGVVAADTYTVTWHAPQENFQVVSLQRDVPKLVGGLQSISVNATIPANLSIPGQEGKVDWGEAEHTGGLLVAVTGTGAGALLLPEVTSGPPGWTVLVAQAILAGLSYKMGLAEATHPGTVSIEGNADYNEYLADLNHQVAINQQPAGQKDMVRFKPEALAEQALAASQTPDHWGSDPYFMSCTAQWQGGWYTDIGDSLGDGYNVNGYTGPVPAHTEIPTHLFKYFVWTCSTPLPQ